MAETYTPPKTFKDLTKHHTGFGEVIAGVAAGLTGGTLAANPLGTSLVNKLTLDAQKVGAAEAQVLQDKITKIQNAGFLNKPYQVFKAGNRGTKFAMGAAFLISAGFVARFVHQARTRIQTAKDIAFADRENEKELEKQHKELGIR